MAHLWGSINLEDINFDNGYNKNAAYAQSKLANVLFTRSLAKRLEGVYHAFFTATPQLGLITCSLQAQA